MKVLRSSLIVAAAVITAACGSKTTNTTTAPPSPSVHSVSVAPSTATLSVLQVITMSAAVTADAGATVTPIAWTSSDNSKVTVTGTTTTGTVTAVAATPGVAICAAVGGASGCATVVVNGSGQLIPASVSIQSIQVNGLNNTDVNPAAVAGTIDIRVNVSPGNETVSKVVVLVGTTRADSQTFTAAQSASLRYAADQAVATQSAFPPILFSINTAKFSALTGVPTWTNASYPISVQLYTTASGATPRSTATYQTPLTFVNANTYVLTSSTNGKSATSTAGYSYKSGSISTSVLPVIYTGGITMAAGTITFGTAGCDATGPRTLALAPTAVGPPATAPWTATFTTATATGAAPATNTNFKSYEFRTATPACAAVIATGEGFTVTGTDNNGNGFLAGVAPANAAANTYRMDNVAPGAPSIATNPNGRQNGWINPGAGTNAVTLTGLYAAATTPNGWMVNGTADAGVGGYTRMLRIGAAGAGGIADPVGALTGSATPANPSPTVANNSLCAVPTATDALGNESAVPVAGALCTQPGVAQVTLAAGVPAFLGVDIAPPTIAFSGGLAAGSSGVGQTGASVGIPTCTMLGVAASPCGFQVTVTDTGIVGNSGMQATSPVNATVVIRTAASALSNITVPSLCAIGTVNAAGACVPSSVGMALPVFPLVATAPANVANQTIIGYYTFSGSSVDAAGNPSTAVVTRTIAYNPVATNIPTLSAATPGTIPISGASVTFNALGASGNTTVNGTTTFFDLWKVTYSLAYAGGLAGPLVYPSTKLNGFNGATMLNNNVPVGITVNGFVRQVEAVTSACNVALTTGGPFKPNSLSENLFDQVGNASGAVASAIVGAQVTTGVVYTGAVGPLQTFAYILSDGVSEAPTVGCQFAAGANSAVKVSTGGASTSADPTTVTLTADVYGPTATYNPLFARVDFYVFIGGNMEQIGSATTYSTVDDGSTNGRKHRFSFVWTPGIASPILATPFVPISSGLCAGNNAANLQLYAVGVSAAGDALVTPLNANVCLTNAP